MVFGLSLALGRAVPLADARAAGVGQHGGADGLEVGDQAVALDGGADLLASRARPAASVFTFRPRAAAWRAIDAARVMSS